MENKVKYKCCCLKPEDLTKYGFVESKFKYELKTNKGSHNIVVWKKGAYGKRAANQLIFPMGTPVLNYEIIMLLHNMLSNGVITITKATEIDTINNQIEKLERKLAELKERCS